MTTDLTKVRTFFSRTLPEQAADDGVTLSLEWEEELVSDSSMAAATLGSMFGGSVQADYALGFKGEVAGRRFHFVQPLAHHVQGPGELYCWLRGAPPEALEVPGLSWWERTSPLLRGLRSPQFQTAKGETLSLGEASQAALARTSRLARTGLAVWRLPWFAQLACVGDGTTMLVVKALPGEPDRARRPLKRIAFAELAALADAVEGDLVSGPAERQEFVAGGEFVSLLR